MRRLWSRRFGCRPVVLQSALRRPAFRRDNFHSNLGIPRERERLCQLNATMAKVVVVDEFASA